MNLRRWVGLTALVLAAGAVAEAADGPAALKTPGPKALDGLGAQLNKLRPKGWTQAPRPHPEGVTLVLLGPRTAKGRAVLAVRPLDPGLSAPATPEGLQALAAAVGIDALVPVPAEARLGQVFDAPVREGVRIRYVLHPRGLLTLAAPPPLLPEAYAWVMKGLARLP